ncbi:MAG: helix-turn-helix domain-containing protein [Bacteriovoracaceae bacterium]
MVDKLHYKKHQKRYYQTTAKVRPSQMLFDNEYKATQEDENTYWLDTNEAANFLRLSPNALRILVHRAQVKYFKFGSRLRFRVSDLQLLHQSMEV